MANLSDWTLPSDAWAWTFRDDSQPVRADGPHIKSVSVTYVDNEGLEHTSTFGPHEKFGLSIEQELVRDYETMTLVRTGRRRMRLDLWSGHEDRDEPYAKSHGEESG